jgi:hypothetical protein
MRRDILAHLSDPAVHLDPLVREAVERIGVPASSS